MTSPMMSLGEVLQAHSNTDLIAEDQNETTSSLPAKAKKKKKGYDTWVLLSVVADLI